MNNENVCAVVVTFNRLNLLKNCIISLLNQTRAPSSIVVVNNNSNDGTTEWLNTQNNIVVIHQENLGGSGGFNTGINAALALMTDWVWLMDDDVEPDSDCLEIMMATNLLSQNKYDVLQPDRYPVNNKKIGWRYGNNINYHNPFRPWTTSSVCASDHPNLSILPISNFPFEGPLIRTKVLRSIGDVDIRFFIIMDDADYSMRVLEKGFKIGFVKNARMQKNIGYTSIGLKNDFKLYYLIRNNIIFDRKYFSKYVSIIRNTLSVTRILLVFIKQGLYSGNLTQIKEAFRTISKAIRDGINFKI